MPRPAPSGVKRPTRNPKAPQLPAVPRRVDGGNQAPLPGSRKHQPGYADRKAAASKIHHHKTRR